MNDIFTPYKCSCGGRVVMRETPYHRDYRAECTSCGRHTSWSAAMDAAEKEWIDRFGSFVSSQSRTVMLPEKHGRLVDIDRFLHDSGLEKAKKYDSEDRDYSYSTMMMYEIADMIDDIPVVVEATDEMMEE